MTAVRTPDGTDATELVNGLRDRFGITIANGHGPLKGKVFRLGHIGWFDVFDVTTQLAAVEIILSELGAGIERGVAVTAALEAYEHSTTEAASVDGKADDARPVDPAAVGGGGA